ncbi:MAG: hypothetical protein LQ341_007060 [Variospora aurantia]|nr:MAG: hypothetical protein LQ341_007060 [Variospora aurantia]
MSDCVAATPIQPNTQNPDKNPRTKSRLFIWVNIAILVNYLILILLIISDADSTTKKHYCAEIHQVIFLGTLMCMAQGFNPTAWLEARMHNAILEPEESRREAEASADNDGADSFLFYCLVFANLADMLVFLPVAFLDVESIRARYREGCDTRHVIFYYLSVGLVVLGVCNLILSFLEARMNSVSQRRPSWLPAWMKRSGEAEPSSAEDGAEGWYSDVEKGDLEEDNQGAKLKLSERECLMDFEECAFGMEYAVGV